MVDELDVVTLVARIESEYREMPGLQLTARQMQRMWCLAGDTCEVVIDILVSHGTVVKTRREAYARAGLMEQSAAAAPEDERAAIGRRHDVDDAGFVEIGGGHVRAHAGLVVD